jgi:hypothetical protein
MPRLSHVRLPLVLVTKAHNGRERSGETAMANIVCVRYEDPVTGYPRTRRMPRRPK